MHHIVRKLLALTCSAMLMLSTADAAPKKRAARSKKATSALIIGNSYTFYNDLPYVLHHISKAGKRPIAIGSYTRGATSLHGFYMLEEHAKARTMLKSGDYKWVILQDQSQTPMYKPEETMGAVRNWTKAAKAAGAKPVLFLTWAHATADAEGRPAPILDMQDKTSVTYCKAAIENDIAIAPVGEAWRLWYRKYPDMPLHSQDLSHPNMLGTYMAACVIYSTITKGSSAGLPSKISNNGKTLINIPSNLARDIQKVADTTVRSFTPEKFLEHQKSKEADRADAASIRKLLTPGANLDDLKPHLGQPTYVSKTGRDTTYQYRLSGDVELALYCKANGDITSATIAEPGKMVEIIRVQPE